MSENISGHPGLLVVLSGPSGVGKTTIARQLERELSGIFSVSMTTRPQTSNDKDGVDYYFADQDQFDRARNAGDLLEWAEVFGHCYGTPREPVRAALSRGQLVILEIDVKGGVQVKTKEPGAFAVFIEPPDEADLLKRLRCRKRDSESVIQHRFAQAKQEIARAKASGVYDAFIVNDDLMFATEKVVELVRHEQLRRRGAGTSSKPRNLSDNP